jgi:DNA primase
MNNTAVDEIKDKLQIEDLVSQYVQLKKVGRSLKGLCPFHSEKTPSFIVSPERGIAYCFGCHKGGDVFRFIQEMEGVDFPDALKILAERTGVKLESHKFEKIVPKDQKDLLIEIHEKVTRFYEENLWNTENGLKVLDYLHKRALTDESIKLFRVGYSPDSYDQTYTHLMKEGFTKKMLVAAGIALSQETTLEKIYDRFRGRLMFPVLDGLGRVVAFGGRALSKEQEPKYLNSPETAVYHKSNVLYGFSHAKPAMKHSGEVMMVEGYMDLIASFQAGVKNVVATSGTAMTVKHLRLVKPFVKTLLLCFDMDLAGQEAGKRAFELAQDFDFNVKVVAIPEGKDAADYAKNHPEKLQEVVKAALPYGDYFYAKLLNTFGTDNFSAKKKILQEFLPFFNMLKSNIEKDQYIRRLARDLDLKESQIYDEIKNIKLPDYHPARMRGSLDEPVQAKKYRADELIIGMLLNFPRMVKVLNDKMAEDLFLEPLKPIYKAIVDQYNDHRVEAGIDLKMVLPAELQETSGLLSLYVSEHYGEIGEVAVEKEMNALIDKIRKTALSARRKNLEKLIYEAETKGDKELWKQLLQELSQIKSYGTAAQIHNSADGR